MNRDVIVTSFLLIPEIPTYLIPVPLILIIETGIHTKR